MADLKVEETEPGAFRLRGDLDADSAPLLLSAVGGRRPVSLDLEQCGFVDSAALSALLTIRGAERAHLLLRNPSAMLTRLLEITNLSDYFETETHA